MGMIGIHLLIDFYGVETAVLNDCGLLAECLTESALACGLTPLRPPQMHAFEGGGVTGVILLSESHIALHSYPEHGFIAVDLFSCGSGDAESSLQVFRERLNPVRELVTRARRGGEIG